MMRCILLRVYLLWGDTYLVETSEAAELVNAQGYRAVTKNGDVFEADRRHHRRLL